MLHLSELVRMAFIAATSDSNQLRLAGLAALQVCSLCVHPVKTSLEVIKLFSCSSQLSMKFQLLINTGIGQIN